MVKKFTESFISPPCIVFSLYSKESCVTILRMIRVRNRALDIAVQNLDADVVTLLRLAALNEEIRANND